MTERFLKILKLMVAHDENRFCFDCNQRGPTYVNMTIGSFVCTSCGGALRKYNHRIKSISMSNFTPVEMEFLRRRGNKACRRIYLAHDAQLLADANLSSDTARDDYLRKKYELKCCYSDPTPDIENDAIKENRELIDQVDQDEKSTRTSTAPLTSANAASGLIPLSRRPSASVGSVPAKVASEGVSRQHSNGTITPITSAAHSLSCKLADGVQSDPVWGAFGDSQTKQNVTDPFSSPPFASTTTTTPDFFADFSQLSTKSPSIGPSVQPPIPAASISPTNPTTVSSQAPTFSSQLANAPAQLSTRDKYAALAELDDIFKSSQFRENGLVKSPKPSAPTQHHFDTMDLFPNPQPPVLSTMPFHPSARSTHNPFLPSVPDVPKSLTSSNSLNPFINPVAPPPPPPQPTIHPFNQPFGPAGLQPQSVSPPIRPFAAVPLHAPSKSASFTTTNPFAPANYNNTANAFGAFNAWPTQSGSAPDTSLFWCTTDTSFGGSTR